MKVLTHPTITIGVVTHKRATAFGKLLAKMIPVVECYMGSCELIVANNSGASAHAATEEVVSNSGIRAACPCRIVDSPQNNIAVGRNIVCDHASHELIAFIDDDEYPSSDWLNELVAAVGRLECPVIAGPIVGVFDASVKKWVRHVDVHNISKLNTGDVIKYAASGNFIIVREVLGGIRFDPAYGTSGGEDTEFFLRLSDTGVKMKWCKEAIVYEDIPLEKSSSGYMLRRFISQGATYRDILDRRGDIQSKSMFVIRAFLLTVVSVTIGALLLLLGHNQAGNWLKRGFSNMGKYYSPGKHLYG